uniref:Eukaryotic translation initiation factor 3 subunit M n=1 Tax=Panagrellus redivivus TaxID=6233 RepID=A0A7E4UXB4_PANRE
MAATVAEPKQSVYFFAYSEENEQLQQIGAYLNANGAKLGPFTPDDKLKSALEIVKNSSVLAKCGADAEQIYNSIQSVIVCFRTDDALQLIKAWTEVLLSDVFKGEGWQSHPGYAVHVYSNLFQFYAEPSIKFFTFRALLEVASRAKLVSTIDTSLTTIQSYIADWALDTTQQRELLRTLHNALLVDNRPRDAAEVMTSLLRSYKASDAKEAEPDARECVRTAIIDPTSFSFDHLLQIPAVQHLESVDALLYKLLNTFISGTLADWVEFNKANPKYVKEVLKVENDAPLLKKVKILTLISLAEKQKNIPYSLIQSSLDIPSEIELEKFIIDVLQSGAISGKLNGVKKEFNVTGFEPRVFGRAEWLNLREKLKRLSANLKQAKKHVELASHPELIAGFYH